MEQLYEFNFFPWTEKLRWIKCKMLKLSAIFYGTKCQVWTGSFRCKFMDPWSPFSIFCKRVCIHVSWLYWLVCKFIYPGPSNECLGWIVNVWSCCSFNAVINIWLCYFSALQIAIQKSRLPSPTTHYTLIPAAAQYSHLL